MSKNEKCEDLFSLLSKLNVKVTKDERENDEGKVLMKKVMTRWIPVADAVLDMVMNHLPSPLKAQQYRVEMLYEGPQDDQVAIGTIYIQ